MTTVAELFGDLDRDLKHVLKRVTRDNARISKPVFALLQRRAAEAVRTVLDIDLGSLALDGWAKFDEVREAARRSAAPEGSPETVRLVEHQIISTHKPTIEVYVDNALVATIALGLEVEIDVHSLDATVEAGRLSRFRTGDLDVRATLSVEGCDIAKRERKFEVGVLLPVGGGITVPTPATSTEHRRPRPTRLRGVLTVAALIVVFGLGGAASRSFEWTAEELLPSSGTAGVVHPGTDWFVRTGPSRGSPDVGTVAPGQEVRVECLDRGWAKLATPHEGKYVYSRGLNLDSTPPGCPP